MLTADCALAIYLQLCYGEVQGGWAAQETVPSATIIQPTICPTSGHEVPMCRLFSTVDSYHEDGNTVSGSLRKIVAETTHFRFDGFDEVAGYTVSVVDNIFGAQQMEEGMAESFYHDVSACLPLSGCVLITG